MSAAAATTLPVISEILAGGGLSLPQAARLFPPARRDRPVNASTIFRWIKSGVTLPNGSILRLEGARLSGRWLTSHAAVERFIQGQTPVLASDPPPAPRTPTQRNRGAERAVAALATAGI